MALFGWTLIAAPFEGFGSGMVFLSDQHARKEPELYVGATLSHAVRLQNRSSTPISITELKDPGKTASVTASALQLRAGEEVSIAIEQPVERLGEFNYRYSFVTNEPGSPRYRFSVSGFAQSAYDPEKTSLSFGIVKRGQSNRQDFELASREVDRLEIISISPAPELLTRHEKRAGLSKEAAVVEVFLRDNVPLGLLSGRFYVTTNVPHQPMYPVTWHAAAYDDVYPSANPVSMGLTHAGQRLEATVALKSFSGQSFTIENIDTTNAAFANVEETRRCSNASQDGTCWEIVLWTASELPQDVQGLLRISTSLDYKEPVPVHLLGRFVSRTTQIQQLDIADTGKESR